MVTQKRESRKVTRTMKRVKSSRCLCSSWNSSVSPVTTDSIPPICSNTERRPRWGTRRPPGPELRGARRAHPEGGHGGPPARCPGPESPKDKTALTRASRDPATGERGQGAGCARRCAPPRGSPGAGEVPAASATCCTPAQGSRVSRQPPLPPARLRPRAGSTGLAGGRVLTSEALRTPSVVVTGVTLGALFASLC